MQSSQGRRLVFMLKEFMNGKKYTTSEMQRAVSKKFGDNDIRTVQRDLKVLQDEMAVLEAVRSGRETIWRIPRSARTAQNVLRLGYNELLSFHVLKAHLKTFSGTVIEEEVRHLSDKLERYAPEDVFSEESLYWDQNIGQFDYTQYDPIIRRAITFIAEKKWVRVEYNPSARGQIKQHNVMLRSLFTYAGSLYAVAYLPKKDAHIALALQNVESIEPLLDFDAKLPDFDFRKWTKGRFGVFWGNPRKVKLKVNAPYKHYFTNRVWHQTQELSEDNYGNLIIEMRVPLGPDFISWIMSWSGVMTVQKPADLRKDIYYKLVGALQDYK